MDGLRRFAAKGIWVVALAAVVSACGGASARHRQVSQGVALTRLYRAIAARPYWATALDLAAVRANTSYTPGHLARCGYDGEGSVPAMERQHFVCELGYLAPDGQRHSLFFRETSVGSVIRPMTRTQLDAFVSYSRSHIPAMKLSSRVPVNIGATWAAQPRVSGTACKGGFDGGEFLIVGPGTRCAFALLVGNAVLEAPMPADERLTLGITDPMTGKHVVLRCGDIARSGPYKCSAANGTVLYLFASKAPRPLTSSPQ